MTIKLDLKNKIINGSFEYWQRNTTFAAVANNAYTADRWAYFKIGTMVHTVSRSTDVPALSSSTYSTLITCTTAQPSLGANDWVLYEQRIEGNMLKSIKNKKVVLTFWVKSSKTGTYSVSIRNGLQNRTLIKDYVINSANTWEKKILRFTHDGSGTWDYSTGVGMPICWSLATGTNFRGTTDVWSNGQKFSSTSQVNAVDAINNTFQLADVCLVEDNEGQTRDPEFQLAGRDIFEELQLCQRYYEKSYDVGVAPGTITNIGAFQSRYILAANVDFVNIKITPKRGLPIVTPYNPETGVVNSHRNTSTNTNLAASANTGFIGLFSIMINVSTSTATQGYSVHWTADAEL